MNLSLGTASGDARTDADARFACPNPAGAAADEEKTLLGIRQARDLVLGKNRELIDALARAEDHIAELTYERDDLLAAGSASGELTAENERLRTEVDLLNEQYAAMVEVEQAFLIARAQYEEQILSLAKERDDAVTAARASAPDAERLNGELAADRRASDARLALTVSRFEETVHQLTTAREVLERSIEQQKRSAAALVDRLAEVQAARDESRQETGRVTAERDALRKQSGREKAALEDRIAALEEMLRASPGAASAPSASQQPPLAAPAAAAILLLSDAELRDSIRAIHERFQAALAQGGTPEALGDLEAAIADLAERSRSGGLDLVHHMTAVAGDFARRLRTTPAKFPASASSFSSAIEMLGWLGLRGRAEMLDLSGALVYAVDDDVDNCECLAMAFEKVALQTKYSVTPEFAAEQIAAHPCELIILDVDLPGMDGFELHRRVRQFPSRATTPVIFLSGHLSTRERLQTLGGENNHFVAKPYNLSELSLRVLSLIVEARLA